MNDQRAQGLKQGSALRKKLPTRPTIRKGAKVWRKPEGLPWTGNPYSTSKHREGRTNASVESRWDSWLGINASLLLAVPFSWSAPHVPGSILVLRCAEDATCLASNSSGPQLSSFSHSQSYSFPCFVPSRLLLRPSLFLGTSLLPLSHAVRVCAAATRVCLDLQSSLCSLSGSHTQQLTGGDDHPDLTASAIHSCVTSSKPRPITSISTIIQTYGFLFI